MTHHSNTIDYVEFGATDLEAIKSFYSTAFGWTFQDFGPAYTAFSNSGIEGGFTTEKAVSDGPLVVLYSDNLEQSLRVITDAGGVITQEIFSFPGGRRFHFKDPSGNELAVWQEGEE